VHTVGVLHLARGGLTPTASVPLGLLQVCANDALVEPARQGALFETAAAFQEVQRAAFALEEVVGRGGALAGVAAATERSFSELSRHAA
jgi:hypothetical protein